MKIKIISLLLALFILSGCDSTKQNIDQNQATKPTPISRQSSQQKASQQILNTLPQTVEQIPAKGKVPSLSVNIPGQTSNSKLTVSGLTDQDCNININDNYTKSDSNGNFTLTIPLKRYGDNQLPADVHQG